MSFSSSSQQFYRNRLAFSHFFVYTCFLNALSLASPPRIATFQIHLLWHVSGKYQFLSITKRPAYLWMSTAELPAIPAESLSSIFSPSSRCMPPIFVFTVKHARGQRSIVALFWGSSRRDALAILIFGSAELFRLGAMRLTNTNDTKPGLWVFEDSCNARGPKLVRTTA